MIKIIPLWDIICLVTNLSAITMRISALGFEIKLCVHISLRHLIKLKAKMYYFIKIISYKLHYLIYYFSLKNNDPTI